MLRYQHRMSKDIDIFVPDPQYLGFVSPRLSDVAEAVSDKYMEGPGYIFEAVLQNIGVLRNPVVDEGGDLLASSGAR